MAVTVQVETQLARLVSLLDLKKATPKTSAPAQAEPEEQQHRARPQLEAEHVASSGSKDVQDKRVAGARKSKTKAGQQVHASDQPAS